MNNNFNYLREASRTASDQFYGELVALNEIEGAFEDFILATAKLDRIKKLLFYGENPKKDLVRSLSAMVEGFPKATACRSILAAEVNATQQPVPEQSGHDAAEHILHAVLGTATEAGEMIEHLHAVIFDNAPLDLVNLGEEVFDGQWYHAMLCRVIGITFDQGQRQNIEKLRTRFPDKFTTDAANNRDLDAERAVLEGGFVHNVGDYASSDGTVRVSLDADIVDRLSPIQTAD